MRPYNDRSGGQGRNRTTDTWIFSRAQTRFWLYISISYLGVRCPVCSTVQDFSELSYAKLTR